MPKLLRVSGVDQPIRESRPMRRALAATARKDGILFVSGVEGRRPGAMLVEAARAQTDDFVNFMSQIGAPITDEQEAALKKAGFKKKGVGEDAGSDTALDGILEPDDDDDDDDDDSDATLDELLKGVGDVDEDDVDEDELEDEMIGSESRKAKEAWNRANRATSYADGYPRESRSSGRKMIRASGVARR